MTRLVPLLLLLAASLPALAQDDDGITNGARPTRSLPLLRGDFGVYDLPPEGDAAAQPARAVIVFASGDAGWTYWEDRACRRLARRGAYVLGLDLARYAALSAKPASQAMLAADFEQIAEAAPKPLLADDAPVFWGGVGGGAAQAVAAAALLPPPPRLAGLLVAHLRARGRYPGNGTGWFERFGFPIRGGGTFALAALAPDLGPLRVVQVHGTGGAAWLEHDSTDWLAAVPGPHRQVDFPEDWRHVGRASKACLTALDAALDWLLTPDRP